MQTADLKYQIRLPGSQLEPFIKCFWNLENHTATDKPVNILPDGYFDILFSAVANQPFHATLIGLATMPVAYTVPANSRTFAVSFKLPAAEYILATNISSLLNKALPLPHDFWGLANAAITDFDYFTSAASSVMMRSAGERMENRKRTLFNKIYESDGAITVGELSNLTAWTSRQMNRYFQSNFGLTLKAYCNILRFRASFDDLHSGQLFPGSGYFDQSHFIREVHKFSGTSPKYLAKNEEDRFIQLSTLGNK